MEDNENGIEILDEESMDIDPNNIESIETKKVVHIELIDEITSELTLLTPDEFNYIYVNREIDVKEVEQAIDLIATYAMQRQVSQFKCDLNIRNTLRSEEREMTIPEIEFKLGHRIKIVNKEENNG